MRKARLKEQGEGYYHCMSRVIERRMRFRTTEKEVFCRMMRAVERFSGVRVLTYAVLGNHWHILAHVPEKKELTDTEFLWRLGGIYDEETVGDIAGELEDLRSRGREAAAERLRERYTYRMEEISEFMKTLKQRFTQWYNRVHNRRGTLWEERFKSLLLEPPASSSADRARTPQESALVTMAAYIDLNAVRVGLVEDPKDYRFCGYGEALGGEEAARAGLYEVAACLGASGSWRKVARAYRQYLYIRGEEQVLADGRVRRGFKAKDVARVLREGGELSRSELLRCRVRYFSDGVALGCREFVEQVYRQHRDQFGVRRRDGARAMRGGEWGGLCTVRDLRMSVISVSAG